MTHLSLLRSASVSPVTVMRVLCTLSLQYGLFFVIVLAPSVHSFVISVSWVRDFMRWFTTLTSSKTIWFLKQLVTDGGRHTHWCQCTLIIFYILCMVTVMVSPYLLFNRFGFLTKRTVFETDLTFIHFTQRLY